MVTARRSPAQTSMDVDDPRETEREFEAEASADHVLLIKVLAACRAVALTLTYDKAANALDGIWARHGRPVSPSFLRAALNPEGETRSYFRLEWVLWFARQSEEVADLVEWVLWFARQSEEVADLVLEMGGRGTPKKTPEEELRDLKELMRRELGTTANKLIRKAEAI